MPPGPQTSSVVSELRLASSSLICRIVAPVYPNISEYESIDTWIDYFGPREQGSPALSDLFKPSLHLKDITKSSESSREGQKLKRFKFYTTTSCLSKSSPFVK